jgi:hypothetical protein
VEALAAVPPAELASPRAYAEKETIRSLQRSDPHLKKRPEFAGDSQKPPSEIQRENTVRVSQLSPALGDGGKPGDEADMRMGCCGRRVEGRGEKA